jgi:hypothetical protein
LLYQPSLSSRIEDVDCFSSHYIKKITSSKIKNCHEKVGGVNELHDEIEIQNNKPVVATIQGFKGLVVKLVILVDIDKIFDHNFSKHMYIGISRARGKLFVMVDEKVNKERMDNLA